MRARNRLRCLGLDRLTVQFVLTSLVACGFALAPGRAEDKTDKKEEKKPEPPRVIVALPLAVKTGTTNSIVIRGLNLTNVTELRFTNEAVKAGVVLGKQTRAEVPKDSDIKKVGDTQIAAEIFLPADTSLGTNWFTLASPDGVSEPRPLLFLSPADLLEEKEPNGGFRDAQALSIGQTVSGIIKDAGDVDVFRFDGTAGQFIRIEIFAAFAGSALDSLVTLHDGDGRVLAVNDDARGGRDSILETKLTVTGSYCISVVDANDKAGPTHVYLLHIAVEK
jgi:hypothetical protein